MKKLFYDLWCSSPGSASAAANEQCACQLTKFERCDEVVFLQDVIIGQGAPNGVKGPYLLMKNLLPSRGDTNYLLVRVHSAPGRGRTALHAVVTVLAGRQRMMRRVGSNGAQAGGGSYLDTVHFGLGRSRFASWVIVEWSNKVIQRRRGVRANRIESFGVV